MLEITIKVDENDADYLTEVSDITEDELDMIRPLIKAIKAFDEYAAKGEGCFVSRCFEHNYPMGEMLREDLGEKPPQELYGCFKNIHELFERFCPDPEHGFHSIISIDVCPKAMKTKLL